MSPELQAKAAAINATLAQVGLLGGIPLPTKMTAHSSYFTSEADEAEAIAADAWYAEQRDRRLIDGEYA